MPKIWASLGEFYFLYPPAFCSLLLHTTAWITADPPFQLCTLYKQSSFLVVKQTASRNITPEILIKTNLLPGREKKKETKQKKTPQLPFLVTLMTSPASSTRIHSLLLLPASPLKGGHKKITCRIVAEKCLSDRRKDRAAPGL